MTGATGNVGREEVASLLAKGATVRAAVFRAGQDALLVGAESVLLDFAAPATYSEALAGVDRLFLLRPPQAPTSSGSCSRSLTTRWHRTCGRSCSSRSRALVLLTDVTQWLWQQGQPGE